MLTQEKIQIAHQDLGLNVADIYNNFFTVVSGNQARQNLADSFADLEQAIDRAVLAKKDEQNSHLTDIELEQTGVLIKSIYQDYWIAQLNNEYVFVHYSLLSQEQIRALDNVITVDDNSLFSQFMQSFKRANLIITETHQADDEEEETVHQQYLSSRVLAQQEQSSNSGENMSVLKELRRFMVVESMRDFARKDARDHEYRAVLNTASIRAIIDAGRLPMNLVPFIVQLPVNVALPFIHTLAVYAATRQQHNILGKLAIPLSFPAIGFLYSDVAWLQYVMHPVQNLRSLQAWWNGSSNQSGLDRDTIHIYEALANAAGTANFALKLFANWSLANLLIRTGPELSTPVFIATATGIFVLSTVSGGLKMMAMESYLADKELHPLPAVKPAPKIAEALKDEHVPNHYRERLFPVDDDSAASHQKTM